MVDYLVLLSTNYSLHILTFNKPPNPIFSHFPKRLNNSLPKLCTLKTSEKLSKNSQIIIELRTATSLSHFWMEWNLGQTFKKKGGNQRKNNAFNRTATLRELKQKITKPSYCNTQIIPWQPCLIKIQQKRYISEELDVFRNFSGLEINTVKQYVDWYVYKRKDEKPFGIKLTA